MLISLISWGHILLEWAPWLAKTLAVSSLSKVVDLGFKRIQFTPDLLPSDLVWSKIYNPDKKVFSTKKGPIFSNLVLTDEINRAPSKVQSALLEAMAEKQVTIWDKSYKLDEPFMVLATMNPIEQDGTYNLPEAQLDRFLIKSIVDYPSENEEIEIMKQYSLNRENNLKEILNKEDIIELKNLTEKIFVDNSIYNYVKDIVFFTRKQEIKKKYLAYWASPRASIAMIKTAKVLALLEWRDYVIPEDINEMAYLVLRHRLILSYEMIAEWVTTDMVIDDILKKIEIK
jgi:MoxR-like ATPase